MLGFKSPESEEPEQERTQTIETLLSTLESLLVKPSNYDDLNIVHANLALIRRVQKQDLENRTLLISQYATKMEEHLTRFQSAAKFGNEYSKWVANKCEQIQSHIKKTLKP